MEEEPLGQVHDLDRHDRHGPPGHLAEQRELDAGEHVAALRPAGSQDGDAGTRHMRGAGQVADGLERVVRLHAGRQVERPVMEQRPAAVVALDAPKIHPDFFLQRAVDSVQVVLKKHILGGNRRVGLQFEHPMPVGTLPPGEGRSGALDGILKGVVLKLIGVGTGQAVARHRVLLIRVTRPEGCLLHRNLI